MFKKIMVPVDLSDTKNPALEIAAKIAQQNQAKITLLHVIERIKFLPSAETESFYNRLKKAGTAKLQTLAKRFDLDSRVETKIILGNRAESIVRYAEETGFDLIIMNSHRVDLKRPNKGWGTISYKVAILSQCPVLLVK